MCVGHGHQNVVGLKVSVDWRKIYSLINKNKNKETVEVFLISVMSTYLKGVQVN